MKTAYLWFKKYFKGWNIYGKLPLIKSPVLIIAGEKDFQFPSEYRREMAQRIKNAELQIIEKAGHNSVIEWPDKINALISGFLKAHC